MGHFGKRYLRDEDNFGDNYIEDKSKWFKKVKLKKCPFCGSKVKLKMSSRLQKASIICTKGKCKNLYAIVSLESKKEFKNGIKSWNRRIK